MKIIFKPRQFSESEGASNIISQGTFQGLGIDFLAVIARLHQMPFLWFSEGSFIELDFESEKMILNAPEDKGEDFHAREVVEDRRAESSAPALVEVVDLAGDTVLESTVGESGGRHAFTIPAGAGPCFVRARKLLGDVPTAVNWGVRVRSPKG